jgi:hypothetical protein
MLACDDQKFSEMANLIDPENQFQIGFFNLYNEVTQQRILLKSNASYTSEKENKFKCCIF